MSTSRTNSSMSIVRHSPWDPRRPLVVVDDDVRARRELVSRHDLLVRATLATVGPPHAFCLIREFRAGVELA